jgi:hypothetical protein
LIIADLDAKNATTNASEAPRRNSGQITRNETLKTWVPKREAIEDLLDLADSDKESSHASGDKVRVAYQTPTRVELKGNEAEALANTFEDALLYRNLAFFSGRQGAGLIARFREAIDTSDNVAALSELVHTALKTGGKADFALDLLYGDDVDRLAAPAYIAEGLSWLSEQLRRKDDVLAPKAKAQ